MSVKAMSKTRMMIRRYSYIMVFLTAGLIQASGQGAYIPPDKPKIVIGIVIEQMRYDLLEKFRDRLCENGIKRLLNEGTYYRNASYQYMIIQSAPGFATISTGAEPSYHGITSDNWYVPLNDELIYCTKDNSVDPVGGTYDDGLHSPVNLLSSTFSDELKIASKGSAKVFSVGMKENSAILSGGHVADGVYWFDNKTGTLMTSNYYVDSLPSWINDFNALNLPQSYLNTVWIPMNKRTDYSDCLPDSNKYEAGFDGINYFPYDLKKMSLKGLFNNKRNYSLLRETPFSDSYITDFTLRLIEKEELGKDDIADFLSVTYSATNYIGNRFGPSSAEMGDAILRLDREIEKLLNYLNEKIGKKNLLIYLTSAHGISEIPAVMSDNRIPSGYFRQNQALQLLRSYLNVIYGEGDWVKGYHEKQIFLNRTLIEDAKIPLEEIQRKVARFMVQFSGVSTAYPYSAFEANDFGNGNLRRILNSFSPQRSGDVIITLFPGWVEKSDYVTDCNSPYSYNVHVPLIWYGWAVNKTSVLRKVNITDIAATLSTLCKVPLPNASTGEMLVELVR
jgi:hypothetical protein